MRGAIARNADVSCGAGGRYALHVVGCTVVLPCAGLAAFMLFVQRAAGTKGLPSLLGSGS